MERHEREHICINMVDLIKTIDPSDNLIQVLLSKQILSEMDQELIRVTYRNEGRYSAAKKLLDILATRRHGYDALREGLQKTGQGEAAQILGNLPTGA